MLLQRRRLEDESAKYEELRNNVQMLRENEVTDFKSLVNVGRDFFVQAKVGQTETLIVVLGAGVSAELSRDEVLAFVDAKQRVLQRCATSASCGCQHFDLVQFSPLCMLRRCFRSLEACARSCAEISLHCRSVRASPTH